jgi:hypothetical protein
VLAQALNGLAEPPRYRWLRDPQLLSDDGLWLGLEEVEHQGLSQIIGELVDSSVYLGLDALPGRLSHTVWAHARGLPFGAFASAVPAARSQ